MPRVLLLAACIFFLAAGAGVAPAAAAEPGGPSPYTVSVIPFYGPEKIWQLYSPLIEYLRTTTGLPWELKLYHDHESLIGDICEGRVSVALLGPVPLGRVMKKCAAQPVLAALGRDGKALYHSVVISSDPAVTSLAELRGKKFGLFRGSTAAHILPLKMLKDAGLGIKSVQPVFFESQDRIMSALLGGEVAAAGVKETLYLKFKKQRIRSLKVSAPLPNFAFCSLPSWPSQAREQFVSALLKLKPLSDGKSAETVRNWDDEVKNGFVLPDKDYRAAVLRVHQIFDEITNED